MKLSDFVDMIEISKGWSDDRKYCVTDKSGCKYLLRISPTEQYERKKTEFENMQKVWQLGIPMCKPIEFGTCDEGVYSLQGWIEGEDAEEVIPRLSDEQIYNYGLEAGRFLKVIYTIPAPDDGKMWADFFNRKINRKMEQYNNCPLKYEKGEAFIQYIEENRHLLKGRPKTYQHGDYHIGNLMIGSDGKLYVIDFNRADYGDPWEEFNRIVWCVKASPLFASGMVDGYFDGDVPLEFWRLLALYVCTNTLSSLPWAIPFGQEQIDIMIEQAKDVLGWYEDMKNPVPKWYVKM